MQLLYLKLKCNKTSKAINMKNQICSVNKLISSCTRIFSQYTEREKKFVTIQLYFRVVIAPSFYLSQGITGEFIEEIIFPLM